MQKIFLLTIGAFLLFSCGSSPVEITATAKIALQQTQTAAPTNTSTPTSTPTATITPTVTPTPLGGGGVIVFIYKNGNKGEITFYDIVTSKTSKPSIQFAEDIQEAVRTFGVSSVSVSPDGKRLAFVQSICPPKQPGQTIRYCSGDIFTSNIDGSSVTQITQTKGPESYVIWSPDGKKIAYISDIASLNDLWIVNSDGSGKKCIDTAGLNVYPPSWSPDSTKLAFSSERDGPFKIYLINADGSGSATLLTQVKGARSYSPSWSPDGKRIIFRAYYTNNNKSDSDIYIVNSDGSNQINLTNGKYDEVGNPTWSPNGNLILFNCNSSICTMYPDGTGIVKLNNFSGTGLELSWFLP